MVPLSADHCLTTLIPLNMTFLKIILIIMGMFRNNMAQQVYEVRTHYPLYISNCTEQHVDSLLLCAAFGRLTKDATFFFNTSYNHCRWNCTFIFSNSPGVSDKVYEWRKYGKGSVFKSMLTITLFYSIVLEIKL